jgi:hypothetical protein
MEYSGTERGEAQTFCNEFFSCFGLDRLEVGAQFESIIPNESTRADLVWGDRLLIEMKRPAERNLSRHYEQVFNYWLRLNPSPKYIILSNFHTIEIHDPKLEYGKALSAIQLCQIETSIDAFLFMLDKEPYFPPSQTEVTKKAADVTINVYKGLLDRYPKREARLFILQCVFAMFAEDVDLLPRRQFTNCLLTCIKKDEKTGDLVTLLFERLNEANDRKRLGRDIPYINGGLFQEVLPIDLEKDEIDQLLDAASYDWSYIRPEIFGTLFEHSMSEEERSQHGAHYTSEVDIQRIVQPTIVRPWMSSIEKIHNLGDLNEAKIKLANYHVLDVTCGSGNFLYIAYRELKRIERLLHNREIELRGLQFTSQKQKGIFPIQNLHGIDRDNFAVMLARVTLWIGQQILNKEFQIDEDDLPLPDLSCIQHGDSLFISWPQEISAYIGNPPFLGARKMRSQLNDEYTEKIHKRYPTHNKLADLCTYFFRRIHNEMLEGARAGLVGTNTIKQNHSRQASLEYIETQKGIIYNAWTSYEWPGEAKVHVSIVNWFKGDDNIQFELDGKPVEYISSRLTPEKMLEQPRKLISPWSIPGSQGVIPRFSGFVLSEEEAMYFIDRDDKNKNVIRPFLIGRSLQTNTTPIYDRFIIDFNDLPLEQAEEYEEVFKIIRQRVKPKREALKEVPHNRHARLYWWQYHNNRSNLRRKLMESQHYIAVARVSKEPHFVMVDSNILPDNTVIAIASSDYYLCGILNSRFHKIWAWMQGSTLKGDLRYTPTSVLQTFPFPPNVDSTLHKKIENATKNILNERSRLTELKQIGLTKLYNAGYPSLIERHEKLDRLVCEAYQCPWEEVQSDQQIRAKLLLLNLQNDS